jgi:hypothetical protein
MDGSPAEGGAPDAAADAAADGAADASADAGEVEAAVEHGSDGGSDTGVPDGGVPDGGIGDAGIHCPAGEYPVFRAESSTPSGFFRDGDDVGFFAHTGDEALSLYRFDGATLVDCGASTRIAGELVAAGTFEGSVMVLTTTGLYDKTDDCTLGLVREFLRDVAFSSCCFFRSPCLIEYDGRLFFHGYTTAEGQELWSLSLPSGDLEVVDHLPGDGSDRESRPSNPQVFAGNLWFTADQPGGRALFRYDGVDFSKVLDSAWSTLVHGDKLYVLTGQLGQSELFEIDESFNVTSIFTPTWPYWIEVEGPLAGVGSAVYVVANYGDLFEVTATGVEHVATLDCGQPPVGVVVVDDVLYYRCDNNEELRGGGSLRAYDTASGSMMNLELPEDVHAVSTPVSFGSGLAFTADYLTKVETYPSRFEASQPIVFDGVGVEPFWYSFEDERAELIGDLNPRTRTFCEEPP